MKHFPPLIKGETYRKKLIFVHMYIIERYIVQVGNDQEKAQSKKKIPTPKTEAGKNQTNNKVLRP